MDKNAMWIEKYRPQSLDDVAAHKEIIDTSMQLKPNQITLSDSHSVIS